MRVPTVVLFLGGACLLSADPASSQPPKAAPAKPTLAARIEVDEHEYCFTVRFLLKNDSDRDAEVTYGRGDKGLEVVPMFHLGGGRDIYITPPTYLGLPKRSLQPNVAPIPAGKEILYGTFTMGYPRSEKETVEDLSATIQFREPAQTFETKPVRLIIPAQKPGAAPPIVATDVSPKVPDFPGEWVNSDNGDLSLRLRVKSARIATPDSIVVVAEIRNNRTAPVTILRPFGDSYLAQAVQIKIWGEQGQIKYTGPKLDYDLNAKAFVTIAPKEVVTSTLELPVTNFAGTDKAGAYTLRYDYSYDGGWDKKVASEGVKGIWHGTMCSREVQLRKK
jgi:hypothetical protein